MDENTSTDLDLDGVADAALAELRQRLRDAEAEVALLQDGIELHRARIRGRDVGQGIHRGTSAQSVNEDLWSLLDAR